MVGEVAADQTALRHVNVLGRHIEEFNVLGFGSRLAENHAGKPHFRPIRLLVFLKQFSTRYNRTLFVDRKFQKVVLKKQVRLKAEMLENKAMREPMDHLQKQVDDMTAYIDSFGDLQETYAHYTYQGLNADELSYLNRPEVLQLMKNVIFPKVTVSSWSVSGNQLTLPVTGENLSDINSLVQELEQVPIVDYCNVMTAVTDSNSTDENGNPVSSDTVTGQIIVYLLDPLYVESGDGSEEYGVAADSDGNMGGAVDGAATNDGFEGGAQ